MPLRPNDLLPIWPLTNPVGTERAPLPGGASMGMPRGGFDPIVDPSIARWPGRPMTEGEYQRVREASLSLFDQAAMIEGGGPSMPGLALLASRRGGTPGPPRGMLDNALAPGARVAPMTPVEQLKTPFDFRAEAGRALPRDNYLKSLDAHASTMFREEAPDELVRLLSGQGIPFGRDEKFLADNLDIALGQGQNKGGIQLAFDASKIQGQVNRSKPAWDLGYQRGTAEYLGKDTTQNFRDALTGIRVPDALNLPKTTAARVSRGLQDLEAKGWTKRALDNGYTEYLPPSTRAPK